MERYSFNVQFQDAGWILPTIFTFINIMANKLLYCNWKVNLVLEKMGLESNLLQSTDGGQDQSVLCKQEISDIEFMAGHLVLKM